MPRPPPRQIISKALSTAPPPKGLPKQSGTSILFLHHGQPRTPFYMRHHLTDLWGNYAVPRTVRAGLSDAYWHGSSVLRKCVFDSEFYAGFNEVMTDCVAEIQKTLSSVTPEFRPFNCQTAFMYDTPGLEAKVDEIIRNSTDSLILFSLYPFEQNRFTQPMMREATSLVMKKTVPFGTGIHEDQSNRIVPNSPVSFNLSTITDIGTNETMIQYWAERIRSHFDDFDSVVFALPLPITNRRAYLDSVDGAIRRIMYIAYQGYPRALPWRVAFYAPWSQFWPTFTLRTLREQVKNLRKNGRNRTLVVPVSELFPNFDTQTVLPALISQLSDNVHLLAPLEHDKALVHSLTEMVKNSLMQGVAAKKNEGRGLYY